jgi:type II secretory pathway pseudopilin PulG
MKKEKGYALLEALISVALLSIIGVTVLGALSTSSISMGIADEQVTARGIAEIQIQGVRKSAFAQTYPPLPLTAEYAGYSVTITAAPVNLRDGNIQRIQVAVFHGVKQVIVMEDLKVNR